MLLRVTTPCDVAAVKSFVAAQVPRYREIATPTVILAGTADDTVSSQIHAQALRVLRNLDAAGRGRRLRHSLMGRRRS